MDSIISAERGSNGSQESPEHVVSSPATLQPGVRPAPHVPDHQLLRCIGRGAYGEVWLARNVLGGWRAVKIVYRSAFDHDRPYQREFEGIKRFEPISRTHESQVDILHVGRNEAEGFFYYVMELADDANAEARTSENGEFALTTPMKEEAVCKASPPRERRSPADLCAQNPQVCP